MAYTNRPPSQKVHFEWRAKSRDKLGFFKIEVDYDNFDFQEDYFSSLMKASMCELSILFLADNEVNQEIYSSMNDLLIFLDVFLISFNIS